jgi:putative ABC transport system permease protein
MAEFFGDFRFAWRTLFRSPAAASIAILALALGIGVNVGIFVWANSILLHPFPYPRLERIVTLWETLPRSASETGPLAPANYFDWKEQARSFTQVARYRTEGAIVSGPAGSERVRSCRVSPAFFEVLGMPAKLGRVLSGGEDDASHSDEAVVSEGFWTSHMAASGDLSNALVTVNGHRVRVIGVMPDAFDFPLNTEVWLPIHRSAGETAQRAIHSFAAIALLRPGVSASQATDEGKAIFERLGKLYPSTNESRGPSVIPLKNLVEGVTNRFIESLLGAALFVLLLACANVGNLQIARAAARQREFAVRSALGASRFRIARHLVAESLVISLAAGVAGLLFASWNLDNSRSAIPQEAFRAVPGLHAARVNSDAVFYTLLLSVAAGLISSLPAILQLTGRARSDLGFALRERGAGNSVASHGQRARSVLIVFELALSLVLLVGAGLMVGTFQKMLDLDQGFDPANVLTMSVSLPSNDYADSPTRTVFYDRALNAMRSLPDVRAAALAAELGPADRFSIEGREEPRPGEPRPGLVSTSARYLEAMRIPLLRGRWIAETDRPDSQKVIVISKNLAEHYWGSQGDPLGHRLRLEKDGQWFTVVGVAGDVIEDWFNNRVSPLAYVPYTQASPTGAQFVARTPDDPLRAVSSLKGAIRAADPNLPVYEVSTLKWALSRERGGVRAAARAMTTYAVIALLLAVTGVYGVVCFFVTARTHDFGIYMALGASRGDVLRMTLRQTMWLLALGLGIGLPLSVLLARALSAALFGVVTVGPGTFIEFSMVLAGAALLASYLPSRRATRIEPMEALRVE